MLTAVQLMLTAVLLTPFGNGDSGVRDSGSVTPSEESPTKQALPDPFALGRKPDAQPRHPPRRSSELVDPFAPEHHPRADISQRCDGETDTLDPFAPSRAHLSSAGA